jgi:hypothetical protein
MAAGQDDYEIAADIGVDVEEVSKLKSLALKEELDRYTGSTEETFGLFATFMGQRIRDLAFLFEELKKKDTRQGAAAVGAVRAQAELYEKIIKRGTELGLIKPVDGGKKLELIGLDDEELASELHRRLSAVQRLRAQSAGVPFSEVTYEPPAHMKKRYAKRSKAKSAPVSTASPAAKGEKNRVFRIKRKASLPDRDDVG